MKLNYLIIHCTATSEGQHITKNDIIRWHTAPKHQGGRGWSRPGYSDIIYLDGSLVNIHPFNQNNKVDSWEITNGVRGLNGVARHVVYVGGVNKKRKPKDTRTQAQKHTLEIYVKFMLKRHPNLQIMGHYQAPKANKVCPSFDVPKWCKAIGIPEGNIWK